MDRFDNINTGGFDCNLEIILSPSFQYLIKKNEQIKPGLMLPFPCNVVIEHRLQLR